MNIKVDSRKVNYGDTFVALRGVSSDGHDYIEIAIKNGATKIIAEEGNYSVETIIVSDTREYLTNYLDENYSKYLNDMTIIGVTGTNGKTTTCYLMHQILNELGIKTSYIGTLGYYKETKAKDLMNTTPDLLDLYELFLDSYNDGYRTIVMEVSSQALSMGRMGKIDFSYAVFTNLTEDHLDYHITMENYANAKKQLFKQLRKNGKAILNIDDSYFETYVLEANQNITYGFSVSDYQIVESDILSYPTTFKIKNKEKLYNLETNLIGKYNVYNLMPTFIITAELTNDFEKVIEKMKNLKHPAGRMDTIMYRTNKVIVDYAHTPDAVENIINAMRETKHNNIYTVLGCGGNRDKKKRPIMAEVATRLSTKVIFTSDNPRFEDPNEILDDMIRDIQKDNYLIEIDRKKAIITGIELLKEDDVLLVLGKGHETYQEIKGIRRHFNDKEIVFNYIKEG